MLASVLSMRVEYGIPQDWGLLKARGRLEYRHDFTGSSWASMGYADLKNGLPYTLNIDPFSRDYLAVGSGLDASVGNGSAIGYDYTTADEPFNSDIGALLPIAPCGQTSL